MSKIEPGSKSPEQIIKETKDRVESSRKESGEPIDIFTVEGLPEGMEPYWLNATKKDLLELSKWRDKYEIVNSQNAPNARSVAKQVDGTHQMGDAILAMRPKEVGERIHREQQELARRRFQNVKREYEQEGRKQRIKTFDHSKEE